VTASLVNGMTICIAAIAIGFGVWKWRVLQERHCLLSAIKVALCDRKAFLAGVLLAAFYLAISMIWGGKGGRIHIVFGRWILNATSGELLAALALAILVMVSMALFVYGVRVMGAVQFRRNGAIGVSGILLALAAAFCP
jgi:hypothetical protein